MSAGQALVAALIVVAGAPAMAQEPAKPWYIGATFGEAHWQPGCSDFAACDANDLALRVLAGYTFNRNLAAEAGFHNLGKAQGTNATIKGNAWEALLVASLPVTGLFLVYGKLGGYRGNAEGSGSLLGVKETDYGGTWGFGAQVDLTPSLALRGEWQSYVSFGGGNLGTRSDINVLSAGALWRFR